MRKKTEQGHRSDRDDIPWGTTRKVSHRRISAPTGHEGQSFETFSGDNFIIFTCSGATVQGLDNAKAWDDVASFAKKKAKELKPKSKKKISPNF